MAKKPKFLPQRRRKLSDQHYIKLKSFEEEWWSFYTAEIYDTYGYAKIDKLWNADLSRINELPNGRKIYKKFVDKFGLHQGETPFQKSEVMASKPSATGKPSRRDSPPPKSQPSRIEPTTSATVVRDDIEEKAIKGRTDIGATTKSRLVKSRLGQGIFKDNVRRNEKGCRVTGVTDLKHLRASHIKPWRDSSDEEKLDGCNGLLLAPHIDHLFDMGTLVTGKSQLAQNLLPLGVEFGLGNQLLAEQIGYFLQPIINGGTTGCRNFWRWDGRRVQHFVQCLRGESRAFKHRWHVSNGDVRSFPFHFFITGDDGFAERFDDASGDGAFDGPARNGNCIRRFERNHSRLSRQFVTVGTKWNVRAVCAAVRVAEWSGRKSGESGRARAKPCRCLARNAEKRKYRLGAAGFPSDHQLSAVPGAR